MLALEDEKIFSTPKNVHKEWSESGFCCSDHFASPVIPEGISECQSSDIKEAYSVSGFHITPLVSVSNLTFLAFFELV